MILRILLLTQLIWLTSGFLPPFILLTPPKFRAGHSSTLHILLFKEYTGSVTMNFYNIAYQNRTLLKTTDISFKKDEKLLKLPVTIPGKFIGDFKLTFNGSVDDGYFGMKEQLTLHPVMIYNHMVDRMGGYKTYVQTDKPIYKPGQTVRFRGFSLDSELKGVDLIEGMKVVIKNPSQITIHEVLINATENVLHKGSFVLAEEAQIGSYTITVYGKNTVSCEFTIEEYVLPKFGVEIEGPKYVSSEDTSISGKVTATYTYGKPVNGNVLLTFAIDNGKQNLYVGPYNFHQINMKLTNGVAKWEIDTKFLSSERLKYLFNPFCTPAARLLIVANITDDVRGFQAAKTSSDTKFSQSSFKLTFNKNTQRNYVAGFPYYVELDVKTLSKSDPNGSSVKLTMISGLSDLKYFTKTVRIKDEKVFAMFDVPEDACALKITAEMEINSACDAVFACFQPERMVSKGDEYIRFVKNEPKTYNSGETVSYTIYSNKAVELLHFVIIFKGNIVSSWNSKPSWIVEKFEKNRFDGTFKLSTDLNLRSRLIVLSANDKTGFILADAIDLDIVEFLPHSVNIRFNRTSTMPGENVTLYLASDPRSIIGVAINDASLNLLKQPCKILTKYSTMHFLNSLDSGTTKDLSCKEEDVYRCESSTEIKITDVKTLLMNEGLFVVSNMNMFSYEKSKISRISRPIHVTESYMTTMGAKAMKIPPAEDPSIPENEVGPNEEQESEPRLRNIFPKSWIWTDVISNSEGKEILTFKAPDTITGWVGNAFGLSPKNGLGFSDDIEFTTFMPFFISLDLPYSGTVGERITIPIRLFNYLDTQINALVKITSDKFEAKSESITISANKASTIDYVISLTESGLHAIRVVATSESGSSDAIEKNIFVKPGGERMVESTNLLIMEKKKTKSKSVGGLRVTLPKNYIPGSHTLKLVAVGDILGEAVSGISNLIQLPSGCGEQNMHKIAINVFSANYLKSLYNKLPENIEYNIKHNLNVGLQQQFAYRKGSPYSSRGYSIFKGGDTSDWLSAFVHKITSQFPMDIHLPCDTGINSDRDYLLSLIPYASSFTFTINAERKGWSPYQYNYHKQKDIYWNAYYIISLLEGEGSNRCGKSITNMPYYSAKLSKTCNATAFSYRDVGDCCYHHMVSYAINLCEKHNLLDIKDFRKPYDDTTCLGRSTDKRFMFAACEEKLEYKYVKGSSKSIEATGYAALYLMSKNKIEDSVALIMWLVGQRNENGGFRSSQDTVIGLQALSKFAELSNADMSDKTSLSIYIGRAKEKTNSWTNKLSITNKNKLTIQEVMLPPLPVNYKIRWNGIGVAFVQLISTYHVTEKKYKSIFKLKANLSAKKAYTQLKVGFSIPVSEEVSPDAMFIMEISAPTGMVFSKSLLDEQILQNTEENNYEIIHRHDFKEMGQKLLLYLSVKSGRRHTLEIPINNKFHVINRAPAQLSLINYYEPSLRETIFYHVD